MLRLAVALGFLLAAVHAAAPDATGAAAGPETVLRVGTLTELEPLSPLATSGFWYAAGYTGLVHLPLLTFGPPDGRLAPCLARAWEVSADNRSLTFHLRPGARWHDGAPVTAADAAFTLDYIRDHQVIAQIWRFYESGQAVDDTTLVVRFREPVAYYQSLMFPWPPVLPRHVWAAVDAPEQFASAQALVGAGVFAFVAYDADARVAYLRRAPASTGAPATAVDRVEVRFYASPGAMMLALRRGDVDALMGGEPHVPPAFVDAVAGEPGVDTLVMESAGLPLMLVFHGRRWPTRDLAFRRAVVLAVDSPGLVATVLRGRGRAPGLGFVPPGSWTFAGPSPPLAQDREGAGALLDSLGFVDRDGDGLREAPDGRPFTLPLVPETWMNQGETLRAAELLVYQMRAVGLAAVVDKHVVDRESELLWEAREYDAYVGYATPTGTRDGGHVYFADAEDFSYGTFADSAYLDLVGRVTAAPDEASYLEGARQEQAWNARHLPGVALAWGTQTYAWRGDRFTGWQPLAGFGIPSYASWSTLRPVAPVPAAADQTGGTAPVRWLTGAAFVLAAAVALWLRRARR